MAYSREGPKRQPGAGVAIADAWSEEATGGSHRSPATAGHAKPATAKDPTLRDR